jgi:hypothetical protein
LIKLIEKYELNDYDSGKAKPIDNDKPDKRPRKNTDPVNDQFVINPYADEVYTNNNVPYIVVKDSIMLRDLSLQLDLMNWQLAQYNDLDKDAAFIRAIISILNQNATKLINNTLLIQ